MGGFIGFIFGIVILIIANFSLWPYHYNWQNGYQDGVNEGNMTWQSEMIKHHVAHYNKMTGKWELNK